MASILDMPEEIMRYASKFLMIEDVVHLSMTCKWFFHMLPTYSLEEKVIDMPNSGANSYSEYSVSKGHWTFDFETPPITSCIFMVTISASLLCEDYDSSDKERNNIIVQLIRPGITPIDPKVIMEEYVFEEEEEKYFERLMIQVKSVIRCFCINDQILNMIQPGDYFRFTKNRGGANRRSLKIRDFTVHTRGLLIRPNKIQQGRNNNSLTKYSNDRNVIETLQINKEGLVNVIKMFGRHDYRSQIHNDYARFKKS